ncbi:hypothetical protein E2C01_010738 [Portunus trituberculatus]|uniref:Uncharacterized protein n=1 Tax=Portunus trituberculatus TaxID=210409 RepID=A0A5B7D972_PORTR|nr:hypothetical protein [Portunus trituberculatus]
MLVQGWCLSGGDSHHDPAWPPPPKNSRESEPKSQPLGSKGKVTLQSCSDPQTLKRSGMFGRGVATQVQHWIHRKHTIPGISTLESFLLLINGTLSFHDRDTPVGWMKQQRNDHLVLPPQPFLPLRPQDSHTPLPEKWCCLQPASCSSTARVGRGEAAVSPVISTASQGTSEGVGIQSSQITCCYQGIKDGVQEEVEVCFEDPLAETTGKVWQRLAERFQQRDMAGVVLVPHSLGHRGQASRHLCCSLRHSC